MDLGSIGGAIKGLGSGISAGLGGIGGLASSALDFGMGMYSANRATAASAKAARQMFQLEYDAFKRRYQDTTADMKAAGLNPILAATGGFNVSGGPSAKLPQTYQAQFGQAGSSARHFADKNKADAETTNIGEQTKLTKQNIIHEIAKIANTKGHTGKMAQETTNLLKQAKILEADLKRVIAVAKQQEVKANAYELLDYINDGYNGMIKLFEDDPYLIDDISNQADKVTKKLSGVLKKTNNYFINGIDAIKHFLNKGIKLPKSPQIGRKK